MKVLVVDDEPDVVEALSLVLGIQWPEAEVQAAYDGDKGLEAFFQHGPDVVLLDVAMPRCSGLEVLRRIRQVSEVPVLMVTVKDAEMDKVKALELGADDYVTKPFSGLELVARIRAVMRRARAPVPEGLFVHGDLTVNFGSRRVTVKGAEVKLTPREYKLLVYLVRNAGRVIPAETLLARVWGDEYRDDLNSLKVYIRRLRRKIEPNPGTPRFILTERGAGYLFHAPSRKAATS